jgi:hypothetical protein
MAEYWFDLKAADVAGAARAVLDSIVAKQEARTVDMRLYSTLYRDKSTTGFDPDEWMLSAEDEFAMDHVSYNVVRMCVDTIVSRMSLHKPMPRFVVEGGSFESAEKAKLMEKLAFGAMRACDIYRLATDALRDAAVYGVGFLRVLRDGDRVAVRRVHPSRVVVDDQCCLDGEPSVAFVRVVVPREQLLADFPRERKTIMDASTVSIGGGEGQPMVEFVEGWHLGSGGKPGRRVAFIESGTDSTLGGPGLLADEEWEGPLPLAVLRYSPDLLGWWGIGVAEQLQGIQEEISETCRKIQVNHRLMAVPYLLVAHGSDIQDDVFGSNEDGRIIKWSGQGPPPVLVTPQAVSPQAYEHLDRQIRGAFEVIGISQLSATQQKPAGLNSGIAIRTVLDVEATRLAVLSRQWEDLFVQLAKLVVREAARIPGYKVKLIEGGRLETISMADARMAEDEYEIQVWPASALPFTPAGKLDRVVELMQAELVSKDEGRELLDMPDLQKYHRLANAAREDFARTFEAMLRTGEYIEPLPDFMDQETALMGMGLCRSYWTRARIDGIELERTDLLVRWMSELADAMAPAQPEAAFDEAISAQEQGQVPGLEAAPLVGTPPLPPGALPGLPTGRP